MWGAAMNNFNMTCQFCDKTFRITDTNRRNWGQAICDTCLFEKQMDPHAKMSIRITQKGWDAINGRA
jgi:hypothetical protein